MKIKVFKFTALFLAVNFLAQVLFPTVAFALTGGPSQPEVESFEPIGTSEMVDVFSGDFVYNIPLLNVGNYPVNISYHSGVSMDQEAGWVGLGWNINPGVINRNMRGLPDDFDGNQGDFISKEFNVRDNKSYGVTGTISPELFQTDFLSFGFGIGVNYNNYRGFGLEQIQNLSLRSGDASAGENTVGLGVNLTNSSQDGMTIGAEVSFGSQVRDIDRKETRLDLTVGSSFNSRAGLKALTWSAKASGTKEIEVVNNCIVGTEKQDINNFMGFNGGYSNGAGSISFVSPTYTTPTSLPMKYTSAALSIKWGGTIYGSDFVANVAGYYSEQKLSTNKKNYKAFGYMNSEKNGDHRSLLDFNREKDVAFTKNTPALPVTNFSYDLYSVSGQGIGGMYRPVRSDVGVVFDSRLINNSDNYSLGWEIASGMLVKGGIDPRVTFSTTKTGTWVDGNTLDEKVSFKRRDNQKEELYYEPFYFKQAGEKSVDSEFDMNNSFYKTIGEDKAVRSDLKGESGGFDVNPTDNLKDVDGKEIPLPSHVHRSRRQKRNESISYLTFKEAKNFAINKNLFDVSSSSVKAYAGKDHHIAEITALNAQGMRYVYGLPTFNKEYKEVTFSTGKGAKKDKLVTDSDGLVAYEDNDNGTSNERGLDHYYSSNATPAYAHSYLLTSVLSPDYIDNDGEAGPSAKDMGNYTLFNYAKLQDDYNWRVPLGYNKANSNEGLYSLASDDKGSYIYGKKEIWNLTSIEDKNFIAVFTLKDREDGLGVVDEHGEKNTASRLKYLEKIELFNKNDLANPIKTVHFEYDYYLCPNVPNNTGTGVNKNGVKEGSPGYNAAQNINVKKGKLTLRKIYFTYKNSKKAKFSPYVFDYTTSNPEYNIKKYDRWGNFKNFTGSFYDVANFPYAEQNKTKADENASAWSLTNIDLPSGGNIKVNFESDDYAYVQDKEAMQMFKVLGVANNKGEPHDFLYDDVVKDYEYIVVGLDHAMSTDEFKNAYLKDDKGKLIQDLYFRFRVYLGQKNEGWDDLSYMDRSALSDFVPGYCSIVESDIEVIGTKAYIKMGMVPIGDRDNSKKINPIVKSALQFSRLYNPRLAYGLTDATDGGIDQVIMSIVNSSPLKNLIEMVKGANRAMMDKRHCKYFLPNESYVRLYNPSKVKRGGGARVSSIIITDNSKTIDQSDNADDLPFRQYGQKYTYTTKDKNGNEISSGVASYEPLLGGDEIPHHQPIAYGTKQEKLLVPDDKYYLEEPMGESFFPAPSVGYSKVTVTSIHEDLSKTGSVVHEFYTAKDFPTRVDRTDMQLVPRKSTLAGRLLQFRVKNFMNASQGYMVELNDMHGKPKATWVYGHDQKTYISGVEYKYKSIGNKLDNKATIILPDGQIKEANIGVDFDMITDMREQSSQTTSAGINGNLAAFIVAIFPGMLPLILPAYSSEQTRFRSIVATKVVNRYGLLDQTIVHDLGSQVVTKNIGWDGETGEVLVTQVQNNFNDPVYNITFPAHWAHNRMGPAYQNIGTEYEVELSSGTFTSSEAPFEIGDELIAIYNKDQDDATKKAAIEEEMKYRFYVVEKVNNKITIMGGKTTGAHPSSTLLNGKTIFKIVRSGRRNLSNIPVGNIVCLKNPLRIENDGAFKNQLNFEDFGHQVLAASAAEFDDQWKIFCACNIDMDNYYNPVYYGASGIWRPKRSYTYLTERSKTSVEANLRTDGYFKSFTSFWKTPGLGKIKWDKAAANWTWVSEITAYDPYAGAEIENVDPLHRYSNAGNGFNHQVPTTVSSNAKYSDILFESFEESDKKSCVEQKIKFTGGTIENKSHSGRSSIKIPKSSGGSSLTNLPVCK